MFRNLQSVLTAYFAASEISKPQVIRPLLLGQAVPAPANLSSDLGFQHILKTFDATLSATLSGTTAERNTSFSISIFSASDSELLYERHHTTDLVARASAGTNVVDGDSIYRVCSISKLMTVYTFLVQNGDRHLNDPITHYVPELLENAGSSAVTSNWEDITLGELASHLSGMARDHGLNDFAAAEDDLMTVFSRPHLVLPPLPNSDKPRCGYKSKFGTYMTCNKSDLVSGIANSAAVFPASYTPAYCNDGFVLFALALERLKNDTLENMMSKSILEPLNLGHTSYSVPSVAKREYNVIPGNSTTCGWDDEFGAFAPAGANYMSLRDISKVGRSILNSDLLSRTQTRRWMKPKALLTDLTKAVGMPWEIERIQLDGRTVDLYTKNGDWMVYDTKIVLVPDFDLGFSVLAASDSVESKLDAGLRVISAVCKEMVNAVLPAFEKIAVGKAKRAFAGRYSSLSSDGLVHSIVVVVDSQPALKVAEWFYNGTDILKEVARPFIGDDSSLGFFLQPNEFKMGNNIGFTGIFGDTPWEIVDIFRYGKIGLEQFVFKMDDHGEAISLQSMGLRSTLYRS